MFESLARPKLSSMRLFHITLLVPIIGCRSGGHPAAIGDPLCVADAQTARIAVFDGDIDGDADPIRTITSSTLRPSSPVSVAFLPATDQIVVAESRERRLDFYGRTATGASEPASTLERPAAVGWVTAGNHAQTVLYTTLKERSSYIEPELHEIDTVSGNILPGHRAGLPSDGRTDDHLRAAALDPARQRILVRDTLSIMQVPSDFTAIYSPWVSAFPHGASRWVPIPSTRAEARQLRSDSRTRDRLGSRSSICALPPARRQFTSCKVHHWDFMITRSTRAWTQG